MGWIRDLEKTYPPGTRCQKKHRIPEPQHWFGQIFVTELLAMVQYNMQTKPFSELGKKASQQKY
jgi:hypothetical protein